MYFYVTIQWDDGSDPFETYIKWVSEPDEQDDLIFFYGLSRREIEEAIENQTLLQDGWRILNLLAVYDKIS